jgi:phosphoserine aminotransferase
MMSRVYNFGPGPSTLPESVLNIAREGLPEWGSSGMSVMEMSHHSKEFMSFKETAEADLRELLEIPSSYRVLFLPGGGTGQFAAVPLNLRGDKAKFNYLNTGLWSDKAIEEAKHFGEVHIVASSKEQGYKSIPARLDWSIDPDADFFHYTSNETINGVEFKTEPVVENQTIVADMSSNLLTRPVDVSRFGLIYAGSQKNMGPAGIAVVIVREDLIGHAHQFTPSIFDYKMQADAGSKVNTPPTYNVYLIGLVLEWIKEQGGLSTLDVRNIRKADKLYAAIDSSSFYDNPVDPFDRSRMNVPFHLPTPDLEKTFLSEAKAHGLAALEGHRLVGGLRASIYNAMSEEGVDALVSFMHEFERKKG